MKRILIIDDEPQIRRFLRIGLSAQQYSVVEAEDGESGLAAAALETPDLIILDLGLPDRDGAEVLTALREFSSQPVIILSVRDSEREKVGLLDAGANDYVVKPFSIQELLARIRVLLRDRGESERDATGYDDGRLRLDVLQHRVFVDNAPVALSRKEFRLLQLLIENRDKVMTHRQLLKQLWGDTHLEDTHYLRILVKKLRARLNDDAAAPRFVETEPGIGYRFLSASAADG